MSSYADFLRSKQRGNVQKVRELVTSGAITRAGLARAAGLHANTLRDCSEESWNPTAETVMVVPEMDPVKLQLTPSTEPPMAPAIPPVQLPEVR